MDNNENMGFLLEKEKAEATPTDYVLGGNGEPISGIGDPVAGIGAALYAWPDPIDGIYPRTLSEINHASRLINTFCQKWLPDGEVQRGSRDWMTCTANWLNNDLENQFNYTLAKGLWSKEAVDWFKKVGFINPKNGLFEIADAWSALETNTTRKGNSLRAPVDHTRIFGIVPKSMLFENKSMNWDAYHNKARITQEIRDIAKESLKWIKINWERVPYSDFSKFTGSERWDLFDSYIDYTDGDFIKRLAPDYFMMNYGYHLTINEVSQPKKEESQGEEKMKFFRASENEHPERVYQLGVDQMYHWIKREPTFDGLYGKFSDYEIIDLGTIGKGRIGFTVVNEQTIIEMITNLFKGKK